MSDAPSSNPVTYKSLHRFLGAIADSIKSERAAFNAALVVMRERDAQTLALVDAMRAIQSQHADELRRARKRIAALEGSRDDPTRPRDPREDDD